MVVTPTMLLAGGQTAGNTPHLFAIDKQIGERVGAVEVPGLTRYGMSSCSDEARQNVIIQLRDGLAAMALPSEEDAAGDRHGFASIRHGGRSSSGRPPGSRHRNTTSTSGRRPPLTVSSVCRLCYR